MKHSCDCAHAHKQEAVTPHMMDDAIREKIAEIIGTDHFILAAFKADEDGYTSPKWVDIHRVDGGDLMVTAKSLLETIENASAIEVLAALAVSMLKK
jgi:hypothetical protein